MPSVSFIAHSKESGGNANPDVHFYIGQFVLPELNFKAKSCFKVCNLNAKDIEEPSLE